MFLSAAVRSITLLAFVAPGLAQVPNDECTGALPIFEGSTTGSNLGATTSPVTGTCWAMTNDVWYVFRATHSGLLTGSVCAEGGTNFDVEMAAFSGACGALSQVACTVQSLASCFETEFPTELSFQVQAGQTYYIAIGGIAGAQGNFRLVLAAASVACGDAIPVAEGGIKGSNLGSFGPVTNLCGLTSAVWYSYEAAYDGTATASFCAPGSYASYDPVLAVYAGGCDAPTLLACNDDACGIRPEVRFNTTKGETYFIVVGGYLGEEGWFDLTLSSRPGNWRTRADVPGGIEGAGAGLIGDKIYVSHGYAGGDRADLLIYDLPTDTWSMGPSASVVRSELAGAAVGGKYYAIGGRFNSVLSDVEIYDPVTSSWSLGAPMPTARAGLGVAVVGSSIHAVGGRTGTSPQTGAALAVHEVYDTTTNQWSTRAPMPIAVGDNYATTAIGGKVYVFGGWDGLAPSAHTQVFDPLSGSWVLGTPMPTARDNAIAAVLSQGAWFGHAVVIGGLEFVSGTSTDTVEIYDPRNDTWRVGPRKPTPASEIAASAPSTGSAIHVIGSGPFGVSGVVHEVFQAAEWNETVRPGTPPNPTAFMPGQTPPVIGAVWDPMIYHTIWATTASLDFVGVNPDGLAINSPTSFGTLLCIPPLTARLFYTRPPARSFAIPIPPDPGLIGRRVCAQGGSVVGSTVILTNAIDLTLGSD